MKTFRHYLAESERTYDYRIKILGDVAPDFVKNLEDKLKQFDIAKISKPRTTPVMKLLKDFPGEENQSVTSMDVSFRYPAIEPQIKNIVRLLGHNENHVRLLTTPYEQSIDKELSDIQAQNKDLLDNTEYPSPDVEQTALKKDYGVEPHQHQVLNNAYRSEFSVAGGVTPAAQTTNDLPQGNTSPFATIKRPPRPATGAQPQG